MGSLEQLRAWPELNATEHQLACLDALIEHGTPTKGARAIGTSRSNLRSAISRVKLKAALAGYSPEHDMTHAVPAGFSVKGVSTYYDADGAVRGQWVKSKADEVARTAAMMAACAEFAEPFRGQADPVNPPELADSDLLAVYPLSDPHLGLYCWAQECGVDWDLATAERTLVQAIDHLVELAPPARYCLISNLGDFFHADDPSNRTARQGNALDVDTRWAKVLRTGIRAMRRIIDRALEKHDHVTVINAIGNHDDQSSVMLTAVLSEYYSREPRVTIDTAPSQFHYYRFSQVLIGVTHGHNAKATALSEIMACDRKEEWGSTSFRHWYTGHVHHDAVKEFRGCTVESLRTLAPGDAWHHGQGYRSGRDLKCDIWHRKWGRSERFMVGVERFTP